MPSSADTGPWVALQKEIESFVQGLSHPILVENDAQLFDLTAANWRLSVEFGKLILNVWNSGRSIARRVEDVAHCDHDRLGVYVRKPGGREASIVEFRESGSGEARARTAGRAAYRRQLLARLQHEYPGWKFQRVSNRSDREHSFSAWYTRGIATQGRTGWAFLGLSEEEAVAAADDVLAFALIWLDWLRSRTDRVVMTQLKLFLPPGAVATIAHRAAYLNPRALKVEIFAWRAGEASPSPVDLRDYGNVETRLAPRRQADLLIARHQARLRELLGDSGDVTVMPDPAGKSLSLRLAGLEVARIEGLTAPRVFFGLAESSRRLQESTHNDFRDFLREVRRVRRAGRPEPEHEYYRLQSERWLESLLLKDISRLDPALSPEYVYPQVPAFAAADRGVIDILATTRGARLAVVELKVQEEINLPLQGLDYWLRVKWLLNQGKFRESGYFPGRELSGQAPLLYLVSPAFRFHSTTERLLRYFDPGIQVVLVGINDSWREGVKVLFRREVGR